MSLTPLPNAKEMRDLLEMLMGRQVEVNPDYEIIKPDEDYAAVAFFNDAMGTVCAAVTMDFAACAYAGAALQLIPAAGAEDCIKDMVLEDNYIENVYEVLNVFSSLFNKEGAPHVTIGLMYTPGEPLHADELKMVTSYVERRDSIINVDGYGKGRMGVMCFN